MRYILLLLFVLPMGIKAQTVYTKDGMSLGDKKIFMVSCVGKAEETLMDINGLSVDVEKYCSCVVDELIPKINSDELLQAMKDDKMQELLLSGDNMHVIINCIEAYAEIGDDFTFDQVPEKYNVWDLMVKQCVNEVLSDPEGAEIWTDEMANEYCTCAMEKVKESGISFNELMQVEDENSNAFNEIVMPCIMGILGDDFDLDGISEQPVYNPDDITGSNKPSSEVKLTDYFGKGYKIKLKIGSVSKYFLFDTGASSLLIDKALEQDLVKKGVIKPEHYQGEGIYTLADGREVTGQKVILNDVQIGDYTVNNVTGAVIEEGSLLCGLALISKFSRWEVDDKNKILILYR